MKKKLIKILLDARRRVSAPTKPANEIYPDGDAASIYVEGDSIGDWIAVNGDNGDLTSISSDKIDGSYSIFGQCTSHTDGAVFRNQRTYTIISGNTYQISIWAKRGAQGTQQQFKFWTGFSDFSTTPITSTTWTEYTFNLLANATSSTMYIYPSNSSTAVIGDSVIFDKISILNLGVV